MGYAAGWGLGRIAGGHSLWTQALVTYAFAIAFPQLLRWRLIEQWTGGVQGLYLDFPTPPGGISADRWNFFMALVLLAAGVWLAGNMIASRSGRALMAARDHDLAAAAQGIRVVPGARHDLGHRRRLSRAGGLPFVLPVRLCRADRLQLRPVGADAVRPGDRRHAFAGRRDHRRPVPAVLSRPLAGLGKGLSGLLYAVLLIAAMVLMPTGIVGAVKQVIAGSAPLRGALLMIMRRHGVARSQAMRISSP